MLDATVLAGLIRTNLLSEFGIPAGFFNDANMQRACRAIASAIVTHLKTAAVVTATGTDPQGGTVTVTGTPPAEGIS